MLTIQQAKEELKKGIASYLLKDEKRNYILSEMHKLPFYLLGKPGIGKSDIVRQVAEELGIDKEKITMDSRLAEDLGADSLDAVELIMTLEDEFGISISDEEAVNLVKYQNGYNLASKMIQTLTEIYDRLILQTGV